MAQDSPIVETTNTPVQPVQPAPAVDELREQLKEATMREAWLRDLVAQHRFLKKELPAQLQALQDTDTASMTEAERAEHDTAIANLETRITRQTRRGKRLVALWSREKEQIAELNRQLEETTMQDATQGGEPGATDTFEPQASEDPRKAKLKKKHIIAGVILIPAVISFVYFLLFASPMYISQSSFAIRTAESGIPSGGDLASMLFKSSGSSNDAYILEDYIGSLDIIQDIDKELHLVKHYCDRSHDVISRLWQEPTQDELITYWKRVISPALDPDTGIVVLTARAYTPQMAQALNKAVLERSEALVNAMNQRAQSDAVELANKEIARAEERVRKAQAAMREFRDSNTMLDPKVTAQGLLGVLTSLEAEATTLRTKLREAEAFMQKDAPLITSLKQSLAAVEQQIVEETARVAGSAKSQSNLNSIVGTYEDLILEAEFAQKQLVSAMASLEQARIQQAAQSRYVVAYQQPTLPDESLYPRPYLFTLYIFLGTFILLGIVSLIWASIREHAGF